MVVEFSATTEVKGNVHSLNPHQLNTVGPGINIEDTASNNSCNTTSASSSIATNIDQSQGYSINGNLRPSDKTKKKAMSDETLSLQDVNGTSLDNFSKSTITDPVAKSNQVQHNGNHHQVSSTSSAFSSIPSANNEATVPEGKPAASETETCEGNILNETNSKNAANEQCVSEEKDRPSCDGDTFVHGVVVGETRTIFKEDGLKDVIISVPILQRPPPCKVGDSGHKSHNGHGAFKSGRKQIIKRPVLVRKATPIKIEAPVKLLSDRMKKVSCGNGFAEEDEEEEIAAAGVSA